PGRASAPLPAAVGRCYGAPSIARTVRAGRLRSPRRGGSAPSAALERADGRNPFRGDQSAARYRGAADAVAALCEREGAAADVRCARRRGGRGSGDVALARGGASGTAARAALRGRQRRARTT